MPPIAEGLPDDPETLKAMLIAERIRSERLVQIIKDLQRHRFGSRAESLPADQLLLALEDVEQSVAESAAEADVLSPAVRAESARKRRVNRGALPTHLPRLETVVDVKSKICSCCRGELHRIGEDVSEKLDVAPAQFRVLVVRRPKYACRACEDVIVQAPAPARLIEGGLPTEATVAHVIVSKYADHLPLYRQAQIYERQGLLLDRSTLADWVGRAAFHLRPIRERILACLRSSAKLFADETTAPVLDPGRGRTKIGQLWTYARDDRPWGGTEPPAVAYIYAPDRTASQPIAHLAGFKGVLQVDGYAGYRAVAQKGGVSLAFCWAHVRRRFYDRAVAEASPIATEALQRIALLYAVEKDIRGRGPDERRAVRQERSRPVLVELEPWLRAKLPLISQKSKLAEATPLRALALGRPHPLPRRRPDRDRFQHGRTFDPSHCSQSQERSLRWLRRRRRKLGGHCNAHRKLQTLQRRSVRLPRRRSHKNRQRPPQQRHRRSAPLDLRQLGRAQASGLRTPL